MKYLLTIRKTFESMDDITARTETQKCLTDLGVTNEFQVKLQRLKEQGSPEKVSFEFMGRCPSG